MTGRRDDLFATAANFFGPAAGIGRRRRRSRL